MNTGFPGLPAWIHEILEAFEGGGAFYTTAVDPQVLSPLPIFVVRSPIIMLEIEKTPFVVTMQSAFYKQEGPITQFHLRFYDLAPEIEVVPLSRGIVAQRILEERPFEAECFLNPTHEYDRAMLEALATSPLLRVEFFLDSPPMPYQGGMIYPNPERIQRDTKEILAQTANVFSSEDTFAKARTRFMEEHPWFTKE